MNTKICTCGQTFRTSAKFNNEEKCAACYAASSAEFSAWLDTLSYAKLSEVFAELQQVCIALGVPVEDAPPVENMPLDPCNPEEVPHVDQDAIDSTFASLLADMEL